MSSEEKSAGQILYEGYSGLPKIGWHGLKRSVQKAYEDAASVVVEFSTAPLRERIAELEKQLSEREPWDDEANRDCAGNAGVTCPHCGHIE
jgi:hypothetical protein